MVSTSVSPDQTRFIHQKYQTLNMKLMIAFHQLVAKKQQKWRKKTPGAQHKVLRSSPSPVNQQSRSPSPFKRSPSPYGKLSRSQSQDSDMMLDSMASEIMEDRQLSRQPSRQESHSSEDHFNSEFSLMEQRDP